MILLGHRAVLRSGLLALCLAGSVYLAGCVAPPSEDVDFDPPEQTLGERLFLETRFAEYFAAHMTDINAPLAAGDPVVAQVQNVNGGPMPGPFAGQSINCRTCHFVDEFQGVTNAGNRTYADFTTRSPIPLAMNGFTNTPRNAMQMVGSLQLHAGPTFLHFDGEFATPEDLVATTLTGRNFGWAPDQGLQAAAHIAQVIREDNGQGVIASQYGKLPYAKVFLGTAKNIPKAYRLPAQYRLDVSTASDAQILSAVSELITQYMKSLLFQQDSKGTYIGSPYDVFLRVNKLPRAPETNESDAQYAQRLAVAVAALANPKFVNGSMGSFQFHTQPFAFGATELTGLRIFLNAATGAVDGSQHAGNCIACHVAPNFTDFRFHNTGVSQEEYDAANGAGQFALLAIPSLTARAANYDGYLPASANHPNASERFRHAAVGGSPQFADLGMWNIYLNPDVPNPQTNLSAIVCATGQNCSVDQGLGNTVAQFKTPTLRDLEDSAPYFHNGSKMKFPDVVQFYVASSQLARQGMLRNAPPEFQGMSIDADDVAALSAFLASLTEDYH
jgi:cytochrome c peroxidase